MNNAWSQAQAEALPQLDVSGVNEQGLLSPNKILSGDELQNKLSGTLGATLANEIGVSATGYGAGASRPVMRGLEGARVQILQNGLSVGDVSSISADHAVANPIQNAHQIEILRGASALIYGSGSSGGLVNVINDRIVSSMPDMVSGAINTSYETVNQGKTANIEVDAPAGPLALHFDSAVSNSNNYQIPGYAEQGGPNANWSINPNQPPVNVPNSGKLPFSYSNQNSLGLGAAYIRTDGYTGVSLERMNHNYGIPTYEGGFIQQSQNRYDFSHQTNDPFDGFSSIKVSAANTNYQHTEFTNAGVAATQWNNTATEVRLEMMHKEFLGSKGVIGAQVNGATLNATDLSSNNYAIVPQTKSNSSALFWVEEGRYGPVKTSLGARYSYAGQNPNLATQFPSPSSQGVPSSYGPPTLQNRQFNLMSYSAGGMLDVARGYGLGLSYTVSQRAPTPQELYSYGPHDSTATFDVGNSNLGTETSHNIEVSFQKTLGLVRSKASLYRNQFSNYIYGFYTGAYSAANNNFSVVQASQASANIKGAEGEFSYNWNQNGISGRVFGDVSQGSFNSGGNLPLQPAPRLGSELVYQRNGWLTSATYIYSYQQNRLATWEVGPTPSYNLVNANLSYTERVGKINWTGYVMLKNLLNEEIRYATTPMAVRLYAPQPGRSLMVGVRAAF